MQPNALSAGRSHRQRSLTAHVPSASKPKAVASEVAAQGLKAPRCCLHLLRCRVPAMLLLTASFATTAGVGGSGHPGVGRCGEDAIKAFELGGPCTLSLFILWLLEREDIVAEVGSVHSNLPRVMALFDRLSQSRGNWRGRSESSSNPGSERPFPGECIHLYMDLGSGDGLSLRQFLTPDEGDYRWPTEARGDYTGYSRDQHIAALVEEHIVPTNPNAQNLPNTLQLAAKQLNLHESSADTCVVACEPNPAHTEKLHVLKNSLQPMYPNFVILSETLAGSRDGFDTLHIDRKRGSAASSIFVRTARRGNIPDKLETVEVKVIDINRYFQSLIPFLDPEGVRMFKMDIEGAEWTVLKSMFLGGSLCQVSHMLTEFHDVPLEIAPQYLVCACPCTCACACGNVPDSLTKFVHMLMWQREYSAREQAHMLSYIWRKLAARRSCNLHLLFADV